MKPHVLDIIIAIPLVWGLYKGFKKGLIIEIATLAALIAGIYGAIRFSDRAAVLLREQWEIDDRYIPILSFAVTFIVIVILVNLLGRMVEKLVDMVSLGFVNKLAGGVFSALKIAVILSVLITMVETLDEDLGMISDDLHEESVLYVPLSRLAPLIIPAVKDNEWTKKMKESLPDVDSLSPGA
ncbi:MAG: CvpA family protein [Flavobacteriales bacterium]|nr:CvpA family protein [Flavobacteriales bacterium]